MADNVTLCFNAVFRLVLSRTRKVVPSQARVPLGSAVYFALDHPFATKHQIRPAGADDAPLRLVLTFDVPHFNVFETRFRSFSTGSWFFAEADEGSTNSMKASTDVTL